jgi:glycosyltransferase involved in cell wall biosynthesis
MIYNNDILLSIIIPTKNREGYAYCAVKHILSLSFDNIQVVVCNNSASDKLGDMLSHYLNDQRVTYRYCNRVLSTIDNFNEAIALAEGDYVCAIGDDDGINPEIMQIVSWAKEKNIPAIKSGLEAIYFWPGSGAYYNKCGNDNGILNIANISCSIRKRNPREEVIKVLRRGLWKYGESDLVRLYHGIVKREYINEMKERTGKYIGGLSPDIYSSMTLSCLVPSVLSIEYPLTIPGICKESSSADSATGKHTGELKDAPHFVGHYNYVWNAEVPPFYSIDTIWADSGLAALKAFKEYSLLTYFDVTALSVKCLRYYPEFRDIIVRNYCDNYKRRSYTESLFKLWIGFVYSEIVGRIVARVTRKGDRNRHQCCIVRNVKDIISAEQELRRFLRLNGYSVHEIIRRADNICF